MSILDSVAQSAGSVSGTNSFRLMPDHEWFTAPATATIAAGARRSLVTIAYGWTHPDDGDQEGVLVLANADSDRVEGLWIDTWHQPKAQSLEAVGPDNSALLFEFTYGGDWGWQIDIQATETIAVTMRNIVPADPESGREAITYDVMQATLSA